MSNTSVEMIKVRILKLTRYALLSAASGLFVSACGGDSSSDDGANPPPTGNNPTSTPTVTAAPSPTQTPEPAATMAPSPTPGPTDAPTINPGDAFNVSDHSPLGGSTNRALVSKVQVNFNKALVPTTAVAQNVSFRNDNESVSFELAYQEGSTLLEITPNNRLAPNTAYTVELSENLMSQDGEALREVSWQFTTTGNLGDTAQEIIDSCMTEVDIEMLDAVNNVRAVGYNCAAGRFDATYPMQWNCQVAAAAIRHTNDMATNDFLEHTGSDGSSVRDRIEQTGYNWNGLAENIAAGQPNVEEVMEDWLTSPTGHCKNIMSTTLVDFGSSMVVPTQDNPRYRRYWTQNFARSRN